MNEINRRSAIAQLGVFTAALAAPHTVAAQGQANQGREIRPGVRQIDLSPPRPSMIHGYKTVSMRDIVFQPGAEIPEHPMDNPMLCHVAEGELAIRQDGKEFIAKKNDAWSCDKGTREGTKNSSSSVAIMRVIDFDLPAS